MFEKTKKIERRGYVTLSVIYPKTYKHDILLCFQKPTFDMKISIMHQSIATALPI